MLSRAPAGCTQKCLQETPLHLGQAGSKLSPWGQQSDKVLSDLVNYQQINLKSVFIFNSKPYISNYFILQYV